MARLARLELPGEVHYLVQRGLGAPPIVQDDEDRRGWLAALHEAARAQQVALHAWALRAHEAHVLVTPAEPGALGRMMQMLGRRHVAAYNRRHGRRGTLFDGRFRGAVVERGDWVLDALVRIDALGQGGAEGDAASAIPAEPALTSSAPHHLGQRRDPSITDPPEYWRLGNTPFERERAFAARLHAGLDRERDARLAHGALHGWAVGSAAFVAVVQERASRPAAPRPRGRPLQGTGSASGSAKAGA